MSPIWAIGRARPPGSESRSRSATPAWTTITPIACPMMSCSSRVMRSRSSDALRAARSRAATTSASNRSRRSRTPAPSTPAPVKMMTVTMAPRAQVHRPQQQADGDADDHHHDGRPHRAPRADDTAV